MVAVFSKNLLGVVRMDPCSVLGLNLGINVVDHILQPHVFGVERWLLKDRNHVKDRIESSWRENKMA